MTKIAELAAALKGDGCTSSPDLFYRRCCDEHDIYYRTGRDLDGNPISRAEADRRLRNCMRAAGKTPVIGRHLLPWVYWAAVRLFGRGHYNPAPPGSPTTPSSPARSPGSSPGAD